MSQFQFQLGQSVVVNASGEIGVVIGRAEYQYNENSYCVRYCAADGRAVEQWWGESALIADNDE